MAMLPYPMMLKKQEEEVPPVDPRVMAMQQMMAQGGRMPMPMPVSGGPPGAQYGTPEIPYESPSDPRANFYPSFTGPGEGKMRSKLDPHEDERPTETEFENPNIQGERREMLRGEKYDIDDRTDPDSRGETESEIDAVHQKINAGHEDDYDWEGDRTPTEADLEYIRENPTDGNLESFFRKFPTYTAEDILQHGGNPSKSPDEYAMDDEEWEETQKDRSTEIDER